MEYNLDEVVEAQRKFFNTHQTFDIEFRISALKLLKNAILENIGDICTALNRDMFKCTFESYSTEIAVVLGELNYAIKNLKKWCKPQKVSSNMMNIGSTSKIYAEPIGVTLIISPWNFPFLLTLSPLISAISAGDCAVLKTSRFAPYTSIVIDNLICDIFPPEFVSVIQGSVEANREIFEQNFDHVFFTGSPETATIVMGKVARRLIPVTLELGGKSPCIVLKDADIETTAKKIMYGKCINSGQVCIAPDYVLVEKSVKDKLITALINSVKSFYGNNPITNDEYPRMVREKDFERLIGSMRDGKIVYGGKFDKNQLKIEPTIMTDIREDSELLHREIFGPILPIIEVENYEDAKEYIQKRRKPLALYLFTNNKKIQDDCLTHISCGGGCINDTIMQITNPSLPFGGVGNSGMGKYHGYYGFTTFSNMKGFVSKSGRADIKLRYAPYGSKILTLQKIIK